MKRGLVLVLSMVFISSILLYGQKVKIEKDPFSGKESITMSWQAINIWEKVYYRFVYKDDIVILQVAWGVSEETTYDKNEDINLKFDDDSTLTLKNIYKTVSTKGGASDATFLLNSSLGLTLSFEIKEDDLSLFESHLLNFMRLNYETINNKFSKDIEVTEGVSDNIEETYKMFKKELDKNKD